MAKNKELKHGEMTLMEILAISVKHRKVFAILFSAMFTLGSIIYIYSASEVIFYEAKDKSAIIINTVEQGYSWSHSPESDHPDYVVDNYNERDIMKLLFIKSDVLEKLQVATKLSIRPARSWKYFNGTSYSADSVVFSNSIGYDPITKTYKFYTERPTDGNRNAGKLYDEFRRINDTVKNMMASVRFSSPKEAINLLYDFAESPGALGAVTTLGAASVNEIQFFNGDKHVFSIALTFSWSTEYKLHKKMLFITELPMAVIDKSIDTKNEFPPIQEINNLNDILLNTLVNILNENIQPYKTLRKGVINELNRLSALKNKSPDDLKRFDAWYKIYQGYRNPEKDYIRSMANTLTILPEVSIQVQKSRMAKGKYFTFMFIIVFFVSMMLVYAYDFSRRLDLFGEFKRILKKV